MEDDLKSYLLSGAALSALIGTRLYSEQFPPPAQQTLPSVVYTSEDADEEELLDGSSSGLKSQVIRFTILGVSKITCVAVRKEIEALMTPPINSGVLRGANWLSARSYHDYQSDKEVYEIVYNIFYA